MPTVTDTEAGHGEDSGFAYVSSSDVSASSDAHLVVIVSSDSCTGGYSGFASFPSDSDTGTGSDVTFSSHPSDTDACTGSDSGWPSPLVVDAEPDDTAAGADTENETVGVWALQPPFRWTGGGYRVVLRGRRGVLELPVAAYERVLELSVSGHWVHDEDSVRHSDHQEGPGPGVSIQVSPALRVTLTRR